MRIKVTVFDESNLLDLLTELMTKSVLHGYQLSLELSHSLPAMLTTHLYKNWLYIIDRPGALCIKLIMADWENPHSPSAISASEKLLQVLLYLSTLSQGCVTISKQYTFPFILLILFWHTKTPNNPSQPACCCQSLSWMHLFRGWPVQVQVFRLSGSVEAHRKWRLNLKGRKGVSCACGRCIMKLLEGYCELYTLMTNEWCCHLVSVCSTLVVSEVHYWSLADWACMSLTQCASDM